MRRLPVLAALATLLLGTVSGGFSVGRPAYAEEDWFEYDGWTAALFAEEEARLAAEEADFDRLDLNAEVPMRITFAAGETIPLGGEDTACRVSQVVHSVNMTVHFEADSTGYDGDRMTLNITTTIDVWMPTGASAFEKRVMTVHMSSWFSGGGEDNHLETRITTTEVIERDGLWPSDIEAGDAWDFAETIQRNITTENRANKGLWNGSSVDQTLHRQVSWTATEETIIATGPWNDDDTRTLRIEQQIVGENGSSIDWYHAEGYLVKTQHWASNRLILSATLTDFEYAAAEKKSETTSSNAGLPHHGAVATLGLLGLAALRSGGRARGGPPRGR